MTTSLAAAAFAALALDLEATSVQAAPLGGPAAGAIRAHAGDAGQIEPVTWGGRHCYWHHGHRYCHWGQGHWRHHPGIGERDNGRPPPADDRVTSLML